MNSTQNAQRRIDQLLDSGSFTPFEAEGATGFLTGWGKINEQKVYVSAVDHSDLPESPFEGLQHHLALLEQALKNPAPVILLMDIMAHQQAGVSPFPHDPARLLSHPRGIGLWYRLHALLSDKIVQACVVFGRLGASLTFPVSLCDNVVMLKESGMSIGRPDVVKELLGTPVDYLRLGSAEMHARISGSADMVVETEKQALEWTRRFISFFPEAAGAPLPQGAGTEPDPDTGELASLIPPDPNVCFSIYPALKALVDADSLLEIRKGYAAEVVTAFARINGRACGLVASHSAVHGGILFPDTCDSMARFIKLCDRFSIPLVFLADIPGFMVGSGAEQAGIIRKGAELFRTIALSTTPKLSVTLRRNYTAGVYAMAGPGLGDGSFIALPGAVISVYGATVMNKLGAKLTTEKDKKNRQEMADIATRPEKLLEQGLLDECIQPENLRQRIADFLMNC